MLGDRVEGVGEGMGGSGRGNFAGGRGGRGEHFWPEKNFALISLPFSSCKGGRRVRERTGDRYEIMVE